MSGKAILQNILKTQEKLARQTSKKTARAKVRGEGLCCLLEPIRKYTKLGHWCKMFERSERVRLYGTRRSRDFVPSPKGGDRLEQDSDRTRVKF